MWASTVMAIEKAVYVDWMEWEKSHWDSYNVVNRAKARGFNHLIVGVQSENGYVPKEGSFEYLVSTAHRYGLKVSLFLQMTANNDKSLAAWMDGNTFNVHLPDFPAFIADRLKWYVQKYPNVDGVNLDSVRTDGFCLSDFCQQDYYAKYGRNLINDYGEAMKAFDHAEGLLLTDWNMKAVRMALVAVTSEIRAINPSLTISVSSYAGCPGWRGKGADPIGWLNDGLIDHIYHMDYANLINRAHIEKNVAPYIDMNKFTVAIGNFYSFETVPGSGSYAMYPRDKEHVKFLESSVVGNGICYYAYQFLR
jgi:hypothetical protein